MTLAVCQLNEPRSKWHCILKNTVKRFRCDHHVRVEQQTQSLATLPRIHLVIVREDKEYVL